MNSDKASEPNWYVLRSQLKRERLAAANLRRLEGVESLPAAPALPKRPPGGVASGG